MRRKDTTSDHEKHDSHDGDIYTSLQHERILFLRDEINSDRANTLCGQLVFLDAQDPGEDIYLYINSEGGMITETLAIYDVMQAIRSDVVTICIGEAASGASIILSGGAKGKRYALPNARIMMHQPQGGIEGSSRDVEIEARELVRLREQLSSILSLNTGQPKDRIVQILDRDTYMDARTAKEFGVVDMVITHLPSLT